MTKNGFLSPEKVLSEVFGKTSTELNMSEKRRDEVIAAAIFTSFRNQEYGTRYHIHEDYKNADLKEDARGIDMVVADRNGKTRKLQIKGIYIQRSIERRRKHMTRGVAKVLGRRTQRQIKMDSEELTKIMRAELEKIVQDYSGLFLVIHVIADLATQTSLEIAIRRSKKIVSNLKARDVWFLRHIPVRVISSRSRLSESHSFKLIKVYPDKHTYCYTFAL